MGQRTVTFAPGEYYHLYNRGTDKRIIFLDEADYKRFVELLYLCNSLSSVNVREIYRQHNSAFEYRRDNPLVAIGAYCLMPNHFHLLVTPLEDGALTKFMNKLGTSYSMYFNKKYQRNGSLFQGRFKAQHSQDDIYLRYLYSYIHLNPVKLIDATWRQEGIRDCEQAITYLKSYRHSSMPDYLGKQRIEQKILDTKKFPEYFPVAMTHLDELQSWLQHGNRGKLPD